MRNFCFIFALVCIFCSGCKNKPKDQNVPEARLLSDADEMFFLRSLQGAAIAAIMDTLTGYRRVDIVFREVPTGDARPKDTLSIYSNASDTVMIWRLEPKPWVRSFVIKSEKPELIDWGIKVGAPKAVFLDRFRNINDNDTIEIVENQMHRMTVFTAILSEGKIKTMYFINKCLDRSITPPCSSAP